MEAVASKFIFYELEGEGWEILTIHPPKHVGQDSPEKLGLRLLLSKDGSF